MSTLSQLYDIPDSRAVRAFLHAERSLLPLLQTTREKISQWFPGPTFR